MSAKAMNASEPSAYRDRRTSVLLQLHNRGALSSDPVTSRMLLVAGEMWRRFMTLEAPEAGNSSSFAFERVDAAATQAQIDGRMAKYLDDMKGMDNLKKYAVQLRIRVSRYSAEVLDAVARDDLEIELAAKRLRGKAEKLDVTITRERLRTSLHGLAAQLRLPGT